MGGSGIMGLAPRLKVQIISFSSRYEFLLSEGLAMVLMLASLEDKFIL